MNRQGIWMWSVIGGLLLLVIWMISTNNSIVGKEEAVKSAWSQVENVYQRRMDLVPNLVNTVKGYAKHERETLESVIQARNLAAQTAKPVAGDAPTDPKQLERYQKAQQGLGGALSRLLVVVERYPDLKANDNFRDLQVQLEGTENRITVERRRFNEIVQNYNTTIRVFPASLIAGYRGFQPRPYFEALPEAATAPKVEF